ncbi:MAG: signal peptidase I [Candidatus Omnitrophota bacterium]
MKKKGVIREWVDSIVIAAILAIFLRTFFFQIYKIPTTSMVPTLIPGDKIFVSKLTYGPRIPFIGLRVKGFRAPRRGEVVVFIPPHDRKKVYIKRLIGLEGDKVVIKNGNVYINGKMVVDARIAGNYYYNQGDYARDDNGIVVPNGQVFFLGDNSISSLDSRFWGFVDKEDIVGKAVFVWWPFTRVAMID